MCSVNISWANRSGPLLCSFQSHQRLEPCLCTSEGSYERLPRRGPGSDHLPFWEDLGTWPAPALGSPLPEEIITSCLISLLLTAVWTWTPCPSLQLPSFSSCLHATPSPRINFLPTYTHHRVRDKPRQDSDPKTWEFKIRFCLFEHAAIQDTKTATVLLEPCVSHFTVWSASISQRGQGWGNNCTAPLWCPCHHAYPSWKELTVQKSLTTNVLQDTYN